MARCAWRFANRGAINGHGWQPLCSCWHGCNGNWITSCNKRFVFKKHEYRVHATQKKAFFVQQKKKRDGVEDANFQIRNHQNGFIYAHKDVGVPDFVKKMACDAIINLGLDFGAVDIIYNEKNNRWVVLEVNTAPGLSGETLNRYVEMIKELVKWAGVC